MTANVRLLHPDRQDVAEAARGALEATLEHLGRAPLADDTRRAYRRWARDYAGWVAGHAAEHPTAFFDALGAEGTVKVWKADLLGARRLGAASVVQALVAVTLLYRVGTAIRIAPARPRVPRAGKPKALSKTARRLLLETAARRGAQDRALIALMMFTGPRVEEVAHLDLADLVLGERSGSIRYLGKGEQVRVVPVPARCRADLAAWLAERGDAPGALFQSTKPGGGRLTARGVTARVQRIAAAAPRAVGPVHPHQLRHTCATWMRENGEDLTIIQAVLGHADINTTAGYVRPGFDEIAAAMDRTFGEE